MSKNIKIKKESKIFICDGHMMRGVLKHLAQISIPRTSFPIEVEDNYLALHVLDQLKRIQVDAATLSDHVKEAIKLQS